MLAEMDATCAALHALLGVLSLTLIGLYTRLDRKLNGKRED